MLLFIFFACSRAPIEDRWEHGGLIQLKDAFTSSSILNTSDGWILIDTGFNKKCQTTAPFPRRE